MKEKLQSLIQLGKDFAGGMGERRLTIYATSGCYYLFMSLVPIVMIVCCILPYTPFNQTLILNYIDLYFAESLGEIIRKIVNAVYSSNAATLTVSILLTLYSASASMKALMKGIDAAYHFRSKDNIIRFTIRALLYMILLVITLILSLVIMVYGGRILSLLRRYFSSVGILGALLSKGRYLLVMLLLCFVFTILYTLMPTEKVHMKDQLPGAVFSAIIWVVFSSVFTIYVGISDKYGAYGFIGTIMVAMMWMYYCLFFLLIGGYLNSYITEKNRTLPALTAAEPANALTSEPLPSSPADLTSQDIRKDSASPIIYESRIKAEDTAKLMTTSVSSEASPTDVVDDQGEESTTRKFPKGLVIGILAALFLSILSGVLIFLKKGRMRPNDPSASGMRAKSSRP